ncbi:MAG: nucleotidyltransferase domain-containing protein [bacterium]|nr:nucleotidyltransferase domain-containing protein [bacterium]
MKQPKISGKNREMIIKTAKKYGLNFLVLFGSQVSGETHKKSDADIAYSAKKPLSYQKEYNLTRELQKILGFSGEIEIVDLSKASPLLAKEVAFKGRLLSESIPHSFAYFQMYAFKMFVEAAPLLNLRNNFINRNL